MKQFDSNIVIFGMSCSGKTTFAKTLLSHQYICFDQYFHWHLVETLGLSITTNLDHIRQYCESQTSPYVVDGWHLSDAKGLYLPKNAVVYVIWAPYEKIISQYRIPVSDPEEFRNMYKKWYCEINYKQFSNVRYFENREKFVEISVDQFLMSQNII